MQKKSKIERVKNRFPYLMVGLYGACFVLRAELKSMFAKKGWDLMSSEPFFPILRSSLKTKIKMITKNKKRHGFV